MGVWVCSEGLRPSLVALGGCLVFFLVAGGALVCWATDAGVSSVEWLSSGVGWGMRGCGGGCGTGIWTDTFMSADDLS